MTNLEKLEKLRAHREDNPYAQRIISELSYLDALSKYDARIEPETLMRAADLLLEALETQGAITAETAAAAEEMLMAFAPAAKSKTALFVSHAHIDMNWMWGYSETAAVTTETFRTVLGFMEEYPGFTFAQSQASTYEIVEKFAPELLAPIKRYIREGRWEVTAAEWVEPDKNMPNGESLTRQLLQARKYLTALLELPQDAMCIDFVPDTFGHCAQVPEILADAGIQYMYHCRGEKVPHLYNFEAPSGKRTLNYCEQAWYNGEITPDKFEFVPDFCGSYGVDTYLVVYGVGDHGGGPSRRDIERILTYRDWPLTPMIRFGTFREFFEAVAPKRAQFDTVKKELNYVFTGCYTTQSRIKMANRVAEARIHEAEALAACASVFSGKAQANDRLDTAWRHILFNHFHDILPGSGVRETREFALGRFQEAMAYIGAAGTDAARCIAARIDTSALPFQTPEATVSEGGGVGNTTGEDGGFRFSAAERGRGDVRAFHLFNPTPYERTDVASIPVWDYAPPADRVTVTDANGAPIPFALSARERGYWGHQYRTLTVKATVPAYGYATIVLRPAARAGHLTLAPRTDDRSDNFISDAPLRLENDRILAVFDRKTLRLISLTEKETRRELIAEPACGFCLVHENPMHGMTSWRVGPTMRELDLHSSGDVRLCEEFRDALSAGFCYTLSFGNSEINCRVSLDQGSPYLRFSADVRWGEQPERGKMIPRLIFRVPVSYPTDGNMICDTPYAVTRRDCVSHDVPCLSFLGVTGESETIIGLLADTKYGYRCMDGVAAVSLIRSAYDPDPNPEYGEHKINLAVAAAHAQALPEISSAFNHPLPCLPALPHTGELPLSGKALALIGDASVSCVKPAEDGNGIAIRLVETKGETANVTLCPAVKITQAFLTDTNERHPQPLAVEQNKATVSIAPYRVVTVVLRF